MRARAREFQHSSHVGYVDGKKNGRCLFGRAVAKTIINLRLGEPEAPLTFAPDQIYSSNREGGNESSEWKERSRGERAAQ